MCAAFKWRGPTSTIPQQTVQQSRYTVQPQTLSWLLTQTRSRKDRDMIKPVKTCFCRMRISFTKSIRFGCGIVAWSKLLAQASWLRSLKFKSYKITIKNVKSFWVSPKKVNNRSPIVVRFPPDKLLFLLCPQCLRFVFYYFFKNLLSPRHKCIVESPDPLWICLILDLGRKWRNPSHLDVDSDSIIPLHKNHPCDSLHVIWRHLCCLFNWLRQLHAMNIKNRPRMDLCFA